jgi:hypothetical protein
VVSRNRSTETVGSVDKLENSQLIKSSSPWSQCKFDLAQRAFNFVLIIVSSLSFRDLSTAVSMNPVL